ncbi:MAG: hypothetical protein J2P27_05340, partial [Actinobacteria bacterium]|nr:hypothetical protein [Actinomycetota bacterium]
MSRISYPLKATVALFAVASVVILPGATGHSAVTTVPVNSVRINTVPIQNATMVSADTTSSAGGLCLVPGIGDIGGLLGFCS